MGLGFTVVGLGYRAEGLGIREWEGPARLMLMILAFRVHHGYGQNPSAGFRNLSEGPGPADARS